MIVFQYAILLLLNSSYIGISVNNEKPCNFKIIEVLPKDTIQLSSKESVFWFRVNPKLKEYNNLTSKTNPVEGIKYDTKSISSDASNTLELKLPPGTYHFMKGLNITDTSFLTSKPLTSLYDNIVQIVVRENDTYVGYLTELIGLPFVLPPKLIGSEGHQTDLRLGTDCAELAIYGRRRMGFEIPYCGPKGIYEYLNESEKLEKGTVVHFGFQVSVMYEDKGIIGKLDKEDLLIHAYEDGVKIEAIGTTELINKEYKLYSWKE